MQDKTAVYVYRPALVNSFLLGDGIAGINLHLLEDFSQFDVQRLVDDNAHSAIFIMCADVGDGFLEIRILEAGHGDQELIGQVCVIHINKYRHICINTQVALPGRANA